MIFSKQLLMSDAQAITADAGSTNVIDLKANGNLVGGSGGITRSLGKGNKVPLLVQVVEAFNNLTSLAISVQTDDNAAFSSAKTVLTETVLLADLVAGKQFNLDFLPRGVNEQYVRIYYDVTGTAPTTGKITAGIVHGVQSN